MGLGRDFWSFKLVCPKRPVEVSAYTDEELRKLLAGADEKLGQAILIALYTGMREADIGALRYDAESDWLWIDKAKTPEGRRTIRYPKAIRAVVKQWVKDRGAS